jgi:MmgE/PrpD N-terminal domain
MTTTEEILALAARAAPTHEADADLALFTAAAMRGANSAAVRALRTLRPDSDAVAALPDSAAWRAWLSATAAIAGTASGAGAAGSEDVPRTGDAAEDGDAAGTGAATAVGPIERFVVCAAATACGDDCSAAVAAGVRAAALIGSRLTALGTVGWSVPTVSAVIGAGLAAGMMLRLPSAELRRTLGICATQAAGLRAAPATDAGPLQAGKAAFNAVEAAHLARLGFTSSGDPLDGRRALFALFAS